MQFSSLSFLYLFLSATLVVYYLAPKKARNAILLLLSLAFYYVGEQSLVLLMLFSIAVNYCCALGIEHFSEKRALRRLFLLLAVGINFATLAYFKYADLFLTSLNGLLGTSIPLLQIALPIGISFYTFQTMSYTIDVYRGDVKAQKNPIDFAAYVTFFPQLIAGPIVRYSDVACELQARRTTLDDFSSGIVRFCVGLGKKVLLANTLATLGTLYSAAETHTVLFAWLCGIASPLQIYFDFSGYSDMAIGLGRMFGFHFPENFNTPMASRSATEFWRRWHMTLGTWFRDYVYFPLGGSRVASRARRIFNLLLVWLLTGLWHGAAYSFLLWGVYYGVLIALEKNLFGGILKRCRVLSHLYFALITVIGFEIFDAASLSDIGHRLGELVGIGTSAFSDLTSVYYAKSYFVVLLAALLLSLPFLRLLSEKIRAYRVGAVLWNGLLGVGSLLLLVVSTAYLVDGSYNPFLYFRF